MPAKAAHTLWRGILLALFPLSIDAQWQLIEDFEDYPTGSLDPLPYPVAQWGSEGRVEIFTDIPGAGGSKCAWFGHGGLIEGSDAPIGHAWHQIPLPEEIPWSGIGTVFFRMYMTDYELNWHVMLSKVAAGDEPHDIPIWSHNAAILRYNPSEPRDVDVYSGGYRSFSPTFLPSLNTWYNYWIVIENLTDPDSEDVGTYTVYVQGPNDAEPRALTFNDNANLQINGMDYSPVKSLVLIQTTQHGNGIWLIDDIYFAPLDMLNRDAGPGSNTWCSNYLIQHIGNRAYIDTDQYLGWLFLPHGSSSRWVWSLSLSSWIYFPYCPEPTASETKSNWVWLSK